MSSLISEKKIINILGAYDRHNYGDLLFPIILKEVLTAALGDRYELHICGISRSDLTRYGALKTKSIGDLYELINKNDKSSILLIAGGDVLTAQWSSILLSLNHKARIFMKGATITNRFLNRNKLAKFILGGKSELPFVINKSDFPGLQKVIYNSVGGTNFQKLENRDDRPLSADYISVRDQKLYIAIKERNKSVELIPDSAIIMSKFYPVNELIKSVHPRVKELSQKQPFVFFQINKQLASNSEAYLARILKTISHQHNLKICLCPIGRANHHEDHIPLKRIHDLLKDESFYIDEPSIWDTMYLIASSKIYIGSSLHGAITAMSYNTPYMGIKVSKLNDYLKTWSFEPLNKVHNFSEISSAFSDILTIEKEKLSSSRDTQIELIEQSFNQIVNVIRSE
jgi:hypothetical protein